MWLSTIGKVNFCLVTFLTKKRMIKSKIVECAAELEKVAADMKRFVK